MKGIIAIRSKVLRILVGDREAVRRDVQYRSWQRREARRRKRSRKSCRSLIQAYLLSAYRIDYPLLSVLLRRPIPTQPTLHPLRSSTHSILLPTIRS